MDKKEILHNMRIKRDELHQIIMESVKSVLGKQDHKHICANTFERNKRQASFKTTL